MLNLRLALLKDLTNSFDGETIEYKRFYETCISKKRISKQETALKPKAFYAVLMPFEHHVSQPSKDPVKALFIMPQVLLYKRLTFSLSQR